jgi:putative ABC transport system permease protein
MLDVILHSITHRKLRTSLTVFGISLGIFAVIVMGAMSENFNQTFDTSMKLTADKIRVFPESGFFGGSLKAEVAGKVKKVPGVADAFGAFQAPLEKESLGGFGDNMVFAVPPEKQKLVVQDVKLTSGRLLLPGDTYRTVIGSSIARQFDIGVGDKLEINEKNFTVVGVLEYTGSFFDSVAQIPLEQAQDLYKRRGEVSVVLAVPEEGVDADRLAQRIELSVDDVTTFSPSELRRQIEQQLVIFSLITISAALLAAIIGGLSVMNTMLMSVTERTREFGLLKALGAETKDILLMTLGEAIIMGIIGGILGILGGNLLVYYLNQWLESQGTRLFTVTPRLMVVALLFATLLGAVSGLYPAYRAAKMSPMEALRYE